LGLSFADKIIFKDVNANFKSGTINIIKGKNGTGKTCLLQCICGIIPKHFVGDVVGDIIFEPANIHPSLLFGYLMQDPDKQLCFPFIEEELFFGAENTKRDRAAFTHDYSRLIELFPVLSRTNVETNALSFGEKKVLLFSSIILKNPQIFILDEPLAGLSEDYRNKFLKLILELKKNNKIIIIAEHTNFFDENCDSVTYLP
jgi:energy-coupling factor transporter ATP-binding protein EcfA2